MSEITEQSPVKVQQPVAETPDASAQLELVVPKPRAIAGKAGGQKTDGRCSARGGSAIKPTKGKAGTAC